MAGHTPVLLVVKKERNSELIDQLLERHGYAVRAVSSITETDEHLDDPVAVSAVVLDVDGFSTSILSRIETIVHADVPVVVVSQSTDIVRDRQQLHPTVELLEKPVEPEQLVDAVNRLVETSDARMG